RRPSRTASTVSGEEDTRSGGGDGEALIAAPMIGRGWPPTWRREGSRGVLLGLARVGRRILEGHLLRRRRRVARTPGRPRALAHCRGRGLRPRPCLQGRRLCLLARAVADRVFSVGCAGLADGDRGITCWRVGRVLLGGGKACAGVKQPERDQQR